MLSNDLLSFALKDYLLPFLPADFRIYQLGEIPKDVDLLIVDYPTLASGKVRPFKDAKVLLLDLGVSPAEKRGAFLVYGVRGVIQRDATLALLLKAIERVQAGEFWMDQETLREVVNVSRDGRMTPKGITPREKEVLCLLCKGYTNKEIAAELGISLSTVKGILGNLYRKFNVSGRSMLQAVVSRGRLLLDV